MPQRTLTHGLLLLALVALLALLTLLLSLRAATTSLALDAALALNLLLLPLPVLGLLALRRRRDDARAAAAAARSDAEARSRFLTQVSHELRTPLNAAMGLTQLVLQTPLGAEQRELLGRADAASRTLLALINDVLDLAKLDTGQLRLVAQPLRLEEVVAAAIERVRPLHADPAVALVCDWGDASLLGARGALRGDAARLQQVLVILLGNALRFTPAGEVRLSLAALPGAGPGELALSLAVQDSGIGIAPEQLAGLFHTQPPPADDAPLPRRRGLGLLIAHQLVELMGGSLTVQSEAGRRSRFEVRLVLPLDASAAPAAPLPPRRLLLADGHAASRAATLVLLRHLGLGGGLAASADVAGTLAALAEAREQGSGFDWLLLDWQLPGPGPGGAELLAQLRRDHPALRVAVLGAPGQDEGAAQARAFGARALLPRPLLAGELRRLLDGGGGAERAAGLEGESLAGLRVLLVEDHPVNQEIALRLLVSRGARVDLAGDGQQGLERLFAAGPEAYDLVLMDLQMPVLDGLSATRRLRAQPGFEALPVLAMTAHALAEERAECLAAGMQGHIAKPLDVGRLVRELQRYRPAGALPAPPPLLDRATGLRHCDGQRALYRRALQRFVEHYGAGLGDWAAWLQAGDWTELRRAAHTLQGLAATLGAAPLQRAAQALAHSAASADAGAAAEYLDDVAAALTALLDEIRSAPDELA